MAKFMSRSVTLVMFCIFLVSCGSQGPAVLSNVKVETSTRDSNIWMSFIADLNLGSMSFASMSFPILHPRGQTPIGQLDLISGFAGVNQLKVSINVSELADVEAVSATLPNGNLLPMIGNHSAISVNIGSGARVYLVISQTVTAVGVAVPISAFDSIGASLPGLNLFPVINLDKIIATAGIFTGKNPGQNGIAVVADVSKVVSLGNLFPTHSNLVVSKMSLESLDREEDVKLNYNSHLISASQKAKLDSMIYQLNRRKAILRMK